MTLIELQLMVEEQIVLCLEHIRRDEQTTFYEGKLSGLTLMREKLRLLTMRAIDPPSAPSLPSTGTYSRPAPEILSTNSAGN